MKPSIVTLLGLLLFGIASIKAQETSLEEKLSDFSPNKKFAVRTNYDPAIDDGSGEEISKDAIKSIDVVALPDKRVVASLVQHTEGDDTGGLEGKVVWSPDSKWFAYGMSQGHRVTETAVERWKGDRFESVDTEHLSVPAGGDARNQYITPLKWTKPGTLVLEQFTIFFYGKGDSTYDFTVRFDDNGKFHVINRKKVKNRNE
jgi:dipeptidyl aminopeptidase/acylaminoacyl peptidase